MGKDMGLVRPQSALPPDIDRALAVLEALSPRKAEGQEAPCPGFFGPQSISWQINREAALFLGAGRAALLQVAHPFVATAIIRQSQTLSRPLARFHGTFTRMFRFVFGSRALALAEARALDRVHARIKGPLEDPVARVHLETDHYTARDRGAMVWVLATLIDTALQMAELVRGPLPASEREAYLEESRRMALLFGLSAEDLPGDWAAFEHYVAAMVQSPVLTVGPEARQVAQFLLARPLTFMPPGLRALPRWYRDVTAGFLPEPLREGFELAYGPREQARAGRALKTVKAVYPRLPSLVRQVPAFHEAKARLAGKAKAGLAVETLSRAWVGRPRLVI